MQRKTLNTILLGLLITSCATQPIPPKEVSVDLKVGTMSWYATPIGAQSATSEFTLQSMDGLRRYALSKVRSAATLDSTDVNFYLGVLADGKILSTADGSVEITAPDKSLVTRKYRQNAVWEGYLFEQPALSGLYSAKVNVGGTIGISTANLDLSKRLPPVTQVETYILPTLLNVGWLEVEGAHEYQVFIYDTVSKKVIETKTALDPSTGSGGSIIYVSFNTTDPGVPSTLDLSKADQYIVVIVAYSWINDQPRQQKPYYLPDTFDSSATGFNLGWPKIELSPNPIEMPVPITNASYADVSITNSGSSTLDVGTNGVYFPPNEADRPNGNFVAFQVNERIPPNQTIKKQVQGWCLGAGKYTIPVTLITNDPNAKEIALKVNLNCPTR